jgi:hypothetical protein
MEPDNLNSLENPAPKRKASIQLVLPLLLCKLPPMIVFLHIPKTAGTSFRFILENSFGPSHCHATHVRSSRFTQADFEFARRFFPRLKSIAGHNLVDPLQLSVPNPFYVTFLRNPIARVISNYQDSVVRGTNRKSFEESLREEGELSNLHVKLMAGGEDLAKAKRFLERCQVVGLTEKFDLSVHLLKQAAPCRLNVRYRKRRVAQNNTLKQSIENDTRLLELARDYNKLDLELYAFAVDEIFPRLCRKCGVDPDQDRCSYQVNSGAISWKFYPGRWYNKLFRQACKFRARRESAPESATLSRLHIS